MYICVYLCACVRVYRDQRTNSVAVSQELSTFFFVYEGLSLDWSSGWLLVVWQAIEPQGSTCPHLLSSGIVNMPPDLAFFFFFLQVFGFKTQLQRLAGQDLY